MKAFAGILHKNEHTLSNNCTKQRNVLKYALKTLSLNMHQFTLLNINFKMSYYQLPSKLSPLLSVMIAEKMAYKCVQKLSS